MGMCWKDIFLGHEIGLEYPESFRRIRVMISDDYGLFLEWQSSGFGGKIPKPLETTETDSFDVGVILACHLTKIESSSHVFGRRFESPERDRSVS